MTKVYELQEDSTTLDENVEIKVTETREVESTVSVSRLKRQHANCLERIKNLQEEADRIVDEIKAINDDVNIDITIEEIPVKLLEVKEVIAK